jgi:DNA-binding response OmpR family regulator
VTRRFAPHEKRRRILVVEDDRRLAEMYKTALRFNGFDVDVAGDGTSALVSIEQRRPDLVVLDLHLPRLRGEVILSELVSRPDLHRIPVIIVAGSDARLAIAQAKAILRKPCNPDVLLSVIEQHLVA